MIINMRATGVVRTSDDLSRIVIPKSVRLAIGAAEVQPYEFLVADNGDIVLRMWKVSEDAEE